MNALPTEPSAEAAQAAIAEEFGLALDPFPRAADVTFDGYSVGPTAQESTVNAFAILAERHSNENEKKG